MEANRKSVVVSRLDNIVEMMRHQKSGATVHQVREIIHTATMLIDAMKVNLLSDEEIMRILSSVESKAMDIFKKMF